MKFSPEVLSASLAFRHLHIAESSNSISWWCEHLMITLPSCLLLSLTSLSAAFTQFVIFLAFDFPANTMTSTREVASLRIVSPNSILVICGIRIKFPFSFENLWPSQRWCSRSKMHSVLATIRSTPDTAVDGGVMICSIVCLVQEPVSLHHSRLGTSTTTSCLLLRSPCMHSHTPLSSLPMDSKPISTLHHNTSFSTSLRNSGLNFFFWGIERFFTSNSREIFSKATRNAALYVSASFSNPGLSRNISKKFGFCDNGSFVRNATFSLKMHR
mmetsp:Transcript_43994/g.70589  ORF Transcript_43994/g.70589 Transcript_43994/m.70589 type:complete len:271 (-) Transcript_43994:28-840(-)